MMQSSYELLPFQKRAVERALATKRMLINLPAGSGKTLIALDLAQKIQSKRTLVICPAFLRLNWQIELLKWTYKDWIQISAVITSTNEAERLKPFTNIIAMVGYSLFSKKGNVDSLLKQKWDLIICDESHYLRKWESQRCKDVIKLCKKAKRLLFLSATPLISSAADLHPTFSIMEPGKWGTRKSFCDRYCNIVKDFFVPRGYRYEGINKLHSFELRARAKAFVVTAKKSVILAELPPKRVIDLPVSVGRFKKFENVEEMLERIIETGDDGEVKTEREAIGLAKIPAVLELIETFPKNEPIVIFAWHRSVVHNLMACLGHKDAAFILGGLSEQVRMETVRDFTEGKFRALVVSIAAGGLGLNLQRASIALFAELPYSHAEFEQCSDRCWRIGSKKKVSIYKIIAVDSIDQDINCAIEKKRLAAEGAGVAT